MTKPRRPAAPARWAFQDARNRFSEVVDAALRERAQIVTRRGIETAVVISHDEYARMTAASIPPRQSFAGYFLDGPTVDDGDAFDRLILKPRARS